MCLLMCVCVADVEALCVIELRVSVLSCFADVWRYRSELTELGLVYE